MASDKKQKEKDIKAAQAILKKYNIAINVGGCGCCGSPWFRMDYKGKTIVNADEADITMLPNG